MESVVTATSEAMTSPDLVVKCLTVVTGRPVVLGFLSLSALKAFDSTDETLKKVVEAVAQLIEVAGEGDLYVGESVARMLYRADIVNKISGDGQRRYYVVDAEEALLRGRIKYVLPHSPGKSEARINVGTIGHVSRDKGTLAEAVQKFSAQVIVDDMARGFAKQALDKFVDEFNRMEAIKHTKPHITEKPYGKAHRRRFRR